MQLKSDVLLYVIQYNFLFLIFVFYFSVFMASEMHDVQEEVCFGWKHASL